MACDGDIIIHGALQSISFKPVSR